jgi:hypothetical protein
MSRASLHVLHCLAMLAAPCWLGCSNESAAAGAADQSSETWRYEGMVNWSNEHALGDDCGSLGSNAPGAGQLLLNRPPGAALASGDESDAAPLTAYFVTIGCTVALVALDGNRYQANAAPCEWGAWPGLRHLQVTRIVFERLELDLNNRSLSYLATLQRSLPDGNDVERCESVAFALTPPPE